MADAAKGKTVREQTADILAQIDATLKKAGTSKSNIVKCNIWLTDMALFSQMNEAWDAWVPKGATPARATVESPRLAAPGYDVEIMVEAAVLKKAAKAKVAARPVKKAAKKVRKK